jgi:hypothetical protein
MAAYRLPDVEVVAGAGTLSEANPKEIDGAGLSFVLGMETPQVPYLLKQ